MDYINIFGALQDALGVYGGGVNEDDAEYKVGSAAENKAVLLDEAKNAIVEVKVFLNGLKIDLDIIQKADSSNFEKQNIIQQAIDILMVPANLEKFTGHVRRINRIFKALLPDKGAIEFLADRALLNLLLKAILDGMGVVIDDDDILHIVRTQVDESLEYDTNTI